MSHKAIVLDANILIRAVLGKRVRELILQHAATVKFFAPDVAYADARKYLPALLEKRGVESAVAMTVLNAFESMVHPLDLEPYAGLQQQALQRIAVRDGMTGVKSFSLDVTKQREIKSALSTEATP